MSIALMSAVFRLPADATHTITDRFVLVALADSANDEGVCWPLLRKIASKCGIAVSTARHAVDRLEAAGWVRTEGTVRSDGGRGANRYILDVDRLTDDPPRPPTDGPPVPCVTDPPSLTRRTPRPPADGEEPSVEPSVEPSTHTPAVRDGASLAFDEFWDRYPRKIGKPAAQRAWRAAVARHGRTINAWDSNQAVEWILSGLDVWRRWWQGSHTAVEHIPYPSTWLNQDRYADVASLTSPVSRRSVIDELAEA